MGGDSWAVRFGVIHGCVALGGLVIGGGGVEMGGMDHGMANLMRLFVSFLFTRKREYDDILVLEFQQLVFLRTFVQYMT